MPGLDDETLAWLGPERETLQHLLRHAGAFAVFGPSIRVQAGKVLVPGGVDAEPMWQEIVGADPAKPAAFVRRLFGDEHGQLAWFYDSLSQLDDTRLRFALGAHLPAGARVDRARALLEVFENSGSEWRPESQPFTRRPLDPALTLALVDVKPDGTIAGPPQRAFWDRIFNDENQSIGGTVREISSDGASVDPAWITVARPPRAGRRRAPPPRSLPLRPARVSARAERGCVRRDGAPRAARLSGADASTLERAGVRSAPTMVAAAARAEALNQIGDTQRRRVAILQFQALLGDLRADESRGGIPRGTFDAIVTDLAKIDLSGKGYEGRLAAWLKKDLAGRPQPTANETTDPLEDALLAAMAGVVETTAGNRVVEWEGRPYRVSAARAEAASASPPPRTAGRAVADGCPRRRREAG